VCKNIYYLSDDEAGDEQAGQRVEQGIAGHAAQQTHEHRQGRAHVRSARNGGAKGTFH